MAGMLQIQDQGRGCRSGPMPSQRPRPQPVSLGRARATWTDWTQRSWRSAGVTRDTGPNCPGTYGRCCLLTFLTVPPPFPQAPQPLPWGSVCISPPGSTRGQRREGDYGILGLQVVGQRVTPASRVTPGRLASRVQRWERSPPGRILRWRLWGGVSPLSYPLASILPPPMAWPGGGEPQPMQGKLRP